MKRLETNDARLMEGGPALWELERYRARNARYAWTADATFGGVEVNLSGGTGRNHTCSATINLKYPTELGDLMRAVGGIVGDHPFLGRLSEAMVGWKSGTLKPMGYNDVYWNAAEANIHVWRQAADLPAMVELVAQTAAKVSRSFGGLCARIVADETGRTARREEGSVQPRKRR